jgi:hypothetical protein
MHLQTWTRKDSGEAAVVVSYQQSYDKKIMTIYFCTTQNRNPLKLQVKFRNMDISYKSQSKSLGIYHVSHHIWNEIKGLCENTKLKLSEACYIIKSLEEVMVPHAIRSIRIFKGSNDATSHNVHLFCSLSCPSEVWFNFLESGIYKQKPL